MNEDEQVIWEQPVSFLDFVSGLKIKPSLRRVELVPRANPSTFYAGKKVSLPSLNRGEIRNANEERYKKSLSNYASNNFLLSTSNIRPDLNGRYNPGLGLFAGDLTALTLSMGFDPFNASNYYKVATQIPKFRNWGLTRLLANELNNEVRVAGELGKNVGSATLFVFPLSKNVIRTVQNNGKIRLSLPSHTEANPRQFVLEPLGNNKFYVHMRIWDGDHIPANLSNKDKLTLFQALYDELPEGGEILFPKSGPGYYGTRGTVAGLQRLSRDPRFIHGTKGTLQYLDKNGSIKTFEGTSFIKSSKQLRIVSQNTYPWYTGKKHSVNEVVNLDGTVNPRLAMKILHEVSEQFPGSYRMEKRLENPEWHPTDPTTYHHTKNVALSAWGLNVPYGFTKLDLMIAALGHDFGKIVAGDGHAQIGADLAKLVFPDLTDALYTAIAEHMGTPKTSLGIATKKADIINGRNFLKWDSKLWTAALDNALAKGDKFETLMLRDLHSDIKSGEKDNRVFVHSTPKKFTIFDKNHFGETTDDGFNGKGFYFGPTRIPLEDFNYNIPGIVKGPHGEIHTMNYGPNKMYVYLKGKRVFGPFKENRNFFEEPNVVGITDKYLYDNNGLPEIIIGNPKHIKSAEAVTYDSLGKRIPLGERDNYDIDDYLY